MRNSGKSFRICLMALLEASNGKDVELVAINTMQTIELLDRIENIAGLSIIDERTREKITLVNGATISMHNPVAKRKPIILYDEMERT